MVVQKAGVVGSAGYLGNVMNKEFSLKKKLSELGMDDLETLSVATMCVYSGKAELLIAGEKVGELEAKYNKQESKAIVLGDGAGISVVNDLEIELKCIHVMGTGFKYAACATIAGIKA